MRVRTRTGFAISAATIIVSASVATQAQPAPTAATRVERDLLGEKQVPADAYYGVQTARALENFQISSVRMNYYPEFVDAFAIVKLAAARANTQVGAMKPERLAAIEKAYQAIMAGQVSRSVRGRLVSGRRGHLGQHERQRSAGQHRSRAHRATRRANTSTSSRTTI